MATRWYVGIDPGKGGAFALLPGSLTSTNARIFPMPKTAPDLWDLVGMLKDITEGDHFTLLESVHSMPRDGGKSAFTFGRWLGYAEMAVVGGGLLPMDTVRPQVWMGDLNCMTKGDKAISLAKAQCLFPGVCVSKAHADALLIAYYARKHYQ